MSKKSRKDKKKKKKRKNKKEETKLFIPLEYYQPIFHLIIKTIEETGYDVEEPHPKREFFWKVVPIGTYSATQGRDLLFQYSNSLEKEISNVISKHSIAYWLHIHRRLSPTPLIPSMMDDTTTYLVRATLEAAIQKYGMASMCEGVGLSNKLREDSILGGMLMHPDFKFIREYLKKRPQFVLTKFGPQELKEFYDLEKMCFEVWRCAAALRAIGKGAQLLVIDQPIRFVDTRSDELNELLYIYDKRHDRISPNKSATGTVFEKNPSNINTTDFFILPSFNIKQVPIGKAITNQGVFFQSLFQQKFKFPDEYVTNFLWGKFNIQGFLDSHKPFSNVFKNTNGISFIGLILFIRAMILRRFTIWIFRGPSEFIRDYQRAYEGPISKDKFLEELELAIDRYVEELGLNKAELDIDMNNIFSYLELNSEKRNKVDVLLAGPHSVFIPVDDGVYFIDYCWIYRILYNLFYSINLDDQNFKGDALEELVHKGASVLPTLHRNYVH